jgi:hypothetical protein
VPYDPGTTHKLPVTHWIVLSTAPPTAPLSAETSHNSCRNTTFIYQPYFYTYHGFLSIHPWQVGNNIFMALVELYLKTNITFLFLFLIQLNMCVLYDVCVLIFSALLHHFNTHTHKSQYASMNFENMVQATYYGPYTFLGSTHQLQQYSDKGQWLSSMWECWSLRLINWMVRLHGSTFCWMNVHVSCHSAIHFGWDILLSSLTGIKNYAKSFSPN